MRRAGLVNFIALLILTTAAFPLSACARPPHAASVVVTYYYLPG